MPISQPIQRGRAAVAVYRNAHAGLYDGRPVMERIAGHAPLIDLLKEALSRQGFSSIDDFFAQSEAVGDGWL